MFSHQFDTLASISIRNAANKPDNHQKGTTTLGELARSSDFLLFYIVSSLAPPNHKFLHNFQQFLASRNHLGATTAPKKRNNFNATTSPAKFKRLFGIGKKAVAANNEEASNGGTAQHAEINFIVVDVEFCSEPANLAFIVDFGLHSLPPQSYLAKSRLLRALGFVHAPSLFVVDCAELKVVSQAYRALMNDPDGVHFPWKHPPPAKLFSGDLLKNSPDGSVVKVSGGGRALEKSVVALFFGAKWCPPSRQMCKQLCEVYPKIKEAHPEFEIIFCSYDRSEQSFREYFASMPWLALPYGNEGALAYDVQGIPTVLLLDEHFALITRAGSTLLLSDPLGYPWKREPLYELTERTAHRLSELPSLILFTEGAPEDTEFSIQILNACTEWIHAAATAPQQQQKQHREEKQGEKQEGEEKKRNATIGGDNSTHLEKAAKASSAHFSDPLQIFYTGEDPICDYILENLGQEEADLPLLLICDVMAGHLVICDKPDVSEQVLCEFVADYRAGRAKIEPIPSQKQRQSLTVAGIPADVLQQLVLQQPQSDYARSA